MKEISFVSSISLAPPGCFSGRWKPPLNSTDRKVEPDVGKSSVHRCRTGPTLGVSALAPQGVWSHHSSGRRGCVDHDSASGPLRGGWTVIHRHNLNSGRGAPKCEPNRKCGRIESSELNASVRQARSSARLERYLDTVEVWGSSPHGPTIAFNNLPKARPREFSNCNVDCNVTRLYLHVNSPLSGRFVGWVRAEEGAGISLAGVSRDSRACRLASMRMWL